MRAPCYRAAGDEEHRDYAVFTCDEVLTGKDNYLQAPEHVLAFVNWQGKAGAYSHWTKGEATPGADGQELEYYDYTRNRLEMNNDPAQGRRPSPGC